MRQGSCLAIRRYLGRLTLACLLCTLPQFSTAQDLPSDDVEQEELTRAELRRIISEDPEQATNARKALDALDQPNTSQVGRQARNRRERGARRIVNGLPAKGFPAVGALLQGNDPRTAQSWCTGTLVGCDKFLTAAHCIADDPSPKSYLVFFQELGFFEVKDIRWPKDQYRFPYADIALLSLARSVEGIAPMPINTSVKPLNKSIATIVGFGRTGGASYDYGIKREGSAKTETCPAAYVDKKVLCWSYDADVRSLPRNSNTCNGDSGGGVFMRDGVGNQVVQKVFGIVSGGRDRNCVTDDVSYNVDVSEFWSWLEAAGEGRLSSAMCGQPISDRRFEPVRTSLIKLSKEQGEARRTITVPVGIESLRVAMNGEDDGTGKNDFDLLVYQGERSTSAVPACKQDGPGQFAFCEVRRPASGRWSIVVTRKTGEGSAQIGATLVH